MKENDDNNALDSVPSNDISKKNNNPSPFESKIISSKNMSDVMLSFLKPEERAKLFLLKKDTTSINDKLSKVECMRRDKLYADYLHCISNDHKTLKEIIGNIFKSDLEQLNKKLEEANEKIQARFHFNKEKKEIMVCMQPYLKIYMYQMILAEIFSLIHDDFDPNFLSRGDKISKCIENIIKNKDNQQKRVEKIIALEKMEQITEAKTFWDRIQEIRSDATCTKIKDNNKNELRNIMYHSLLYGLLIKKIIPEVNQRCDAKDKTIEEIQTDLATNQSKVEQYQKELEDLQKKAKHWNILSRLVNFNMPKKQKNANENKKSEIEQNQLPVKDLENKSILSLNNNLEVSLDDLESSIKFCDENIKINKEAQEKVEKEINEGKENIAKFERQTAELPVQKEIQESIKNIEEPYKNKLNDVVSSYLLDNPHNINIQVLQIIAKLSCGEDCVYYDDVVDFVSQFIIYSLKHYEHKNFLVAIVESSKILHELLESNYSEEEERRWRRDYYKCYDSWDKTIKYFRKKIEAWGYKYGNRFRRNMRSIFYGVDNDLYCFADNFLLDGDYEYSFKTHHCNIYVLNLWYDKDGLFYWTYPFALVWTAISFAIFFGVLGIILGFTYLVAGACVAFFVMLSLLCASAVTAITFFTVFGIKLKAENKKVEARKLAIDNNKENFHAEFIKSNMWWWLFPHGFMWTAISFAIAFGHFGAIALSLYLTGAAFSGILYFSLMLATCSAVSFIIFGIIVCMQKRKYKNWTSQMDKLQEDRQNISKPQKPKEFYDKFVTINKEQNDQEQNLSKPKTEIANETKK